MNLSRTIKSLKTLILILGFSSLMHLLFAGEGGENNSVKYRITAVKKSDSSVISESNVAKVNLPIALYIPNAFTPNGDGLNDSFGIQGEGIDVFSMNIFNKWGEMIFETSNMDEFWDGTYGGVPVQDGAYVYNIYIRTADKENLSKSGTVTVLK